MKKCDNCIHYLICKWCADNTLEFKFPEDIEACEMYVSSGTNISNIDDYEKLERIYYLKSEIPKLQNELDCLENYFNNKRTVNRITGHEKKNGCKPLLGLFNNVVYHPSAYCDLKQCYLLYDDIREKSCYHKECKHLILLDDNQKKRGIKNKPMKFHCIKCEGGDANG